MKTRSAPEKTRRNTCMRFFYVGMAIVFGLVVFVGFSRTYYLKGIFGRPPLPRLAYVHGALFTSWIALFLIQALSVERNRTDLHRRLGLAGAVLASLMICAGTAMAINAARIEDALVRLAACRFYRIPPDSCSCDDSFHE